jgi:hypothetical protein
MPQVLGACDVNELPPVDSSFFYLLLRRNQGFGLASQKPLPLRDSYWGVGAPVVNHPEADAARAQRGYLPPRQPVEAV